MLNILGPIDSVHTPSTTPIRDKFTTKKLQPTVSTLYSAFYPNKRQGTCVL
ncbi:hypothetical protein EhV125 [Emiliania huxleyi virus 86]|uniref:Uncharacterized protein n=1 Tax=Emiliania huxleyi virus 86 (isolate United Kingdom/English Channel/1999) TaxID=654925 RepID=Q4A308_EHV8U|nr:hypothetical protein EhV125 [Emiliania huxleyi virus 86]CAI65548.1 hypothetical protein EhV125 [Emiliania huxleyi virus 86]